MWLLGKGPYILVGLESLSLLYNIVDRESIYHGN